MIQMNAAILKAANLISYSSRQGRIKSGHPGSGPGTPELLPVMTEKNGSK